MTRNQTAAQWAPIHLTDAIVKRQPAPTRPNRLRRDTSVIGFALRVTRNSNKTFVFNYTTRGGIERRSTIGEFAPDAWSTTAARAEARQLKQLIDQGGDPLAEKEKERAAPTVNDLCDRFEQEILPRKRPATADAYRTILRKYVRPYFGAHTKVADVEYRDIDALHRKVTKEGGPYIANRMHSVVRRLFNLAVRWQMRTHNPAQGVERNPEYHRRRYLSPDELTRLTAALGKHPDQQAANILRVMLLTGCRRGEALSMRWADVDLTEGLWSKLPTSTKQRQHHQTPLSAPVRQLLSEIRAAQLAENPKPGEYVFPSHGETGHRIELKYQWADLCEAAGISGLRMHDLRHSFASQLASGGASLPLIGALLGHSQVQTTSRYAHMFQDPQRAAVEKVGAIYSGAPAAETVPLKRKRKR
jgi:integrase